MKKSILDLGNDVTLQEIMKFKSIKQLERVNFIEDSLDNDSLVIANLSSGCKNILLVGANGFLGKYFVKCFEKISRSYPITDLEQQSMM